MTKKTINIILMIVVVAIWGKVVYGFFVKHEVKKVVEPVFEIKHSSNNTENQSHFILKNIQRDPFLGTFQRKVIIKSIKPKKTLITSKKQIRTKLPKLDYYGYMKNKKTGKLLLIIKINNKIQKNIYLHGKYNGIYYQRIIKDTLFVRFNQKTYKFTKH